MTKGKMPLFMELIDLQTFLPKVTTKVLKVDNRNVRVVLTTVLYSFRYRGIRSRSDE